MSDGRMWISYCMLHRLSNLKSGVGTANIAFVLLLFNRDQGKFQVESISPFILHPLNVNWASCDGRWMLSLFPVNRVESKGLDF